MNLYLHYIFYYQGHINKVLLSINNLQPKSEIMMGDIEGINTASRSVSYHQKLAHMGPVIIFIVKGVYIGDGYYL